MTRHIHDHRAPEHPSNLARFRCQTRTSVGGMVLLTQGELDMATAVETQAALAPALETKPQMHERTRDSREVQRSNRLEP